ncbi:aldehyde dehydrogenase family protein [Aestuariicella hydrocarbonica]|uniref:Aldehyde dehydrogenase n=1 Tax=Pseudomaricurvus hydrocarbonicus TaxID=1470433 RepID=A0A9E5JQF1_9GAMM|nr:aldehyde dehydrogenase family protein [Aestuariicella hydrocarbonica]NHO64758.1 aldehyde dehydrogenase family protein [Aestuariicella hydrocarbonica]
MQQQNITSLVDSGMDLHQVVKKQVDNQRHSFLQEGRPSAAVRIDRLDRAIRLLKENSDAICQALSEDYGTRHRFQSMAADVLVSIEALKHSKKNVKKWMKKERRGAKFPLNLFGAKAYIDYVPLGVVGIIAPWNFPIQLMFSPLANVLAAGNRALIKPSELTPVTSRLTADLFRKYFEADEVSVVTGGVDVAVAFSEQNFDHLVYTGAPGVGSYVMQAAAKNLVPVTLELGGKCPVIVGSGACIKDVVERVMTFKTLNVGQICLAPDTLFIREQDLEEFSIQAKKYVHDCFPNIIDNEDYSSIINDRHFSRLMSYLQDCESRGTAIVPLGDSEDVADQAKRKIQPVLLVNPDDASLAMTEEIFGPLLPVKTYTCLTEVINFINERERPLGLYYFGNDRSEISSIKDRTTSGGMVINDIAAHALQDNMPLGGVGHSGMGSYHGYDGFRQFSHARGTYEQGLFSASTIFKAPYKDSTLKLLEKLMG